MQWNTIKLKMKLNLKLIKKNRSAYLLISPAVVLYLLFIVYSLIRVVSISFYQYNFVEKVFIGIRNYINIFSDDKFLRAVANTFIICVEVVVFSLLISLLISLLMASKNAAFRSFFRVIFYLPVVSTAVAMSIVWKFIYHPAFGLLNHVIGIFGISSISWLGDKAFSLQSVILVLVIVNIGLPVIIYTAAIGNIPKQYYEAAAMDGISSFQELIYITWPLLKPATLFLVVIVAINSFQNFVYVSLLTGGGPYFSSSTIVLNLYNSAFLFNKFGEACAMGVFLTFIIMLFSVFQFKIFASDFEY